MRSFIRVAIVGVLGVAFLAGSGGNAFAEHKRKGNLSPKQVFSTDSVVFGRTYGEWSAAWWQYTLSNPESSSPIFDTADCTQGQSGPVFFLVGKTCATNQNNCDATKPVTRNCTIPEGKAIYFPLLNSEDSLPEEQVNPSGPNHTPLTQINDLRQLVAGFMDQVSGLTVTLDGKSLQDPASFRVQSPAFAFTLPDNNEFEAGGENVAAGTYLLSVDDGYYVMLQPLSKGSHTLHFGGTITPFNFTLDITYNITVP